MAPTHVLTNVRKCSQKMACLVRTMINDEPTPKGRSTLRCATALAREKNACCWPSITTPPSMALYSPRWHQERLWLVGCRSMRVWFGCGTWDKTGQIGVSRHQLTVLQCRNTHKHQCLQGNCPQRHYCITNIRRNKADCTGEPTQLTAALACPAPYRAVPRPAPVAAQQTLAS